MNPVKQVADILRGNATLAEAYLNTAGRTVRVFLVDDNDFERDLMRAFFSQWNVELVEARDRQEAENVASGGRFDLAIVDMRLPIPEDGLSVIQTLRASDPGLGIVVYSSELTADLIRRAVTLSGGLFFATRDNLDRNYFTRLLAQFNLADRAGIEKVA